MQAVFKSNGISWHIEEDDINLDYPRLKYQWYDEHKYRGGGGHYVYEYRQPAIKEV
jgi:hypothetical protein